MPPPGPFSADQYYQQYNSEPFFGSMAPPRPAGIPFGRPGGPLEGVAQSLLPMISEMLRNQVGGAAFTFGSDMNVMSARYAQQYVQQLNAARSFGAQADQPQVRNLLAGFARAFGNDLGDSNVRGAVDRLSGDLTSMLPVLAAMFPDQVDRWLPRGSMAVANASFVSAGRFVIDPATGLPASTDAGYGARVVGDLFRQGPNATSGLGAGRIGQAFEQLVGRGLISDGSDLRQKVELNAAFGPLANGMTGDQARGVQADRVNSQLTSYAKAIAAVNDIFADSGRPNAPMRELFDALYKLTGGGGVMAPEKMAEMVRTSQALARSTGVGLEQQMMMSGQFAAGLRASGQSTALAPYLSQYTTTMAKAYQGAGLIFDGPGGQTAAQASQNIAKLALAGATSDAAQSLGTILALTDQANAGTPLATLGAALKAGQRTVTINGQTYDTLNLRPDQVNELAVASGMAEGMYQRQARASGQVATALGRNGDVQQWALGQLQEQDFRGRFVRDVGAAGGLDQGTALDFYNRLQAQLASGDNKNLDDASLVRAVGGRMGLTEAQISALIPAIGDSQFAVNGSGFGGLAAVNPFFRDRAGRAQRNASAEGRAYANATAFGRGGFGRLISTALASYGLGDDKSWLSRGLSALGLVSNEDVTAAMMDAGQGNRGATERLFGLFGMKYDPNVYTAEALEALGRDGVMTSREASIARDRLETGPLGPFGAGGSGRYNPWSGDGAPGKPELMGPPAPKKDGKVGAADTRPATVTINLTGVKLEVTGDRTSITGGGAMTTGMA